MKRKQAENPKARKRGEEGLPDSRSPSALAPRPERAGQTLGHKTSPEAQSPGEASVAAGVEQDGGALPGLDQHLLLKILGTATIIVWYYCCMTLGI